MFGLIFGTLCLIALIATVRRRRYARFMFARGDHGWSGPGHDGFGYGSRRGFGHARRRNLVRWLFARLDTTPGQEKVMLRVIDEVREHAQATRAELERARKELAAALGGDVLDRGSLEAALARHTELVTRLGAQLAQPLATVHEVLDAEQRKQLAELVADGSFRHGFFGARHVHHDAY